MSEVNHESASTVRCDVKENGSFLQARNSTVSYAGTIGAK